MAAMYELTGAELDAVSGGQANAGGLVAVALGDVANGVLAGAQILNNNKVDVANNSLNGNRTSVGAGVLINLLGGPSGVIGKSSA